MSYTQNALSLEMSMKHLRLVLIGLTVTLGGMFLTSCDPKVPTNCQAGGGSTGVTTALAGNNPGSGPVGGGCVKNGAF